MTPTSNEFFFSRLESVIFGAGKVATLGRELERRGCKRAVIVTGKTLGRSKLLTRVRDAAGSALAGVFAGAAQHSPRSTVEALTAEMRRVDADSVVSFGGGSPNDTAKAAALAVMRSGARESIPLIAIPTTLSAGEFTFGAGVTDDATLVKGGVADVRLQARAVILDPEVTLETPAWLWASTGMRSLDHAVESIYSSRHQPISDALAARSIAMLRAHLRPSLQTSGADELEHRVQCQLAAWFSIFGLMNTRAGISHALGHQIGPMWNVPHGVTSCITLPHVMRAMADITPERFGPICEGFDVRFDVASPRSGALECASRAAEFIHQFEVPHRLRDAGVPEDQIGKIGETVLEEVTRSKTVGRDVTLAEVNAILRAAY